MAVELDGTFLTNFRTPVLFDQVLLDTLCRTTLVEGDDRKWYVLELCERLDGLVSV